MEYKRETFFLKILCPIFESEISMLHLKLTEQELEMLFGNALSVCFFGNGVSRTLICHGITKEKLPLSYNI